MPVVAWTDGTRTFPRQERFDFEVQVPMNDRQARPLPCWICGSSYGGFTRTSKISISTWIRRSVLALQDAATADTSDMQRHALSRLTLALHDDHARVLRPGIDDGLLPYFSARWRTASLSLQPCRRATVSRSDRPSFPSMGFRPRSETSFRGPDVRGDASVCPAPLDIRHRIREERNDRNAGRPRAWQCA